MKFPACVPTIQQIHLLFLGNLQAVFSLTSLPDAWVLELRQGNSWESSHTWLVAVAQEFTLLHLAASDRPTVAPEATKEEIIFLQPRTNPLVEEDSSRFCPIKRWGFPAMGRLCSDKTPT